MPRLKCSVLYSFQTAGDEMDVESGESESEDSDEEEEEEEEDEEEEEEGDEEEAQAMLPSAQKQDEVGYVT